MKHHHGQEWFAGSPSVTPLSREADEVQAVESALRKLGSYYGQSDLDDILSRAHVGILQRDEQSRVLVVNEAFCALLGRSMEELDRMPFDSFTHIDDRERSSRMYHEHLATGTPFEIEKRYLRPDGSAIWCAIHVSFVPDSTGSPQSTIVVAYDISDRKAAEHDLRESEEHYRYTVELNPQIAWTASPDGAILEVSSRWHAVTGVLQRDALGEQWLANVHPDDAASTRRQWMASIASYQPVDVEYRLKMADESYRWFRARAAVRLDEAGKAMRWYGSLEDIHDRRVAEDALRDSEERFRLAAEAAGLGIWDYDAINNRREWSDEFKAMIGVAKDAVPSVAIALACVVPEDRILLQALLDAAQSGDSTARFEVTLRIRRADTGEERWMQTDGWRMHASSGRLTRVLVTIRDVTEERTAADRIRWAATHDGLTGVPNRAHFTEQFERAIAQAKTGELLALVLFDLDRLKEINDTIGHDAGDALLRTFAARLIAAFDTGTIVGRLGGDEFAVLLHGHDRGAMRQTVEAVLDTLREPFEYEAHVRDTQATAGISMFPLDGTHAADLLKAADIALYSGKNTARGTLSVFNPGMRASLQKRASMLNVASAVIRDGRIVPHYQPKVRLSDGKIIGFEALLRWQHDTLGVQPPSTIAAAFEEINLAIAMSDVMLEQVARDMREWLDQGLAPGRVAVNLSPAEFRHDQLIERVLAPFDRWGLAPDLLELEITETVLLGRDTEKIAATLDAFHRKGVTIALDDFGTGYASLTHLKAFPVDVIKIDQGFVENLCEGSEDSAIVDAIVGLAHRLRLDVVAEGIEKEAQARYLLDCGCDFGQGFLYGRAVPASSVRDLLICAPRPTS